MTAANDDLKDAAKLQEAYERITKELSRVIVGQERVVEELLIALFARGHCIITGVPGLAKTLMVSSLARTLSLTFTRIQFTPDLMPSDITGTEVIQENRATGQRELVFIKGPVFANVVLADEINRTPPKTQAALLEAMQERQVTSGGQRYELEPPFFVLATQNPIEQEGTYPLPEAQLDRFMFNILIDYPTEQEECEIMLRTTSGEMEELGEVLSKEELMQFQLLVRRVPISDHLIQYAMRLARVTRGREEAPLEFVRDSLAWGAGPRATQFMILGAKARALIKARPSVSKEDIQAMVHPVMRHRLITNFSAEAEGITTDRIIDRILETVPAEESENLSDGKLPKVFGS
ncbi:MAG: AAA family ATPase [Planctomycetota bacterium]|jgi:MoxR-like ATPase